MELLQKFAATELQADCHITETGKNCLVTGIAPFITTIRPHRMGRPFHRQSITKYLGSAY